MGVHCTRARVVGAAVVAAAGWSAWTGRFALLNWGATSGEAESPLPGDALVGEASHVATRAITIDAPAEEVWRWLVQLGQGRGGFYSYDWLENLAGCDIHSADEIVPEWQELAVGDEVRLHPQVALVVAQVEPGASLVLHPPLGPAEEPFDFSWAFVLRHHPGRTTRLLVRERYAPRSAGARAAVEALAIVSAVMGIKQLKGIRDRAERGRARRDRARA